MQLINYFKLTLINNAEVIKMQKETFTIILLWTAKIIFVGLKLKLINAKE